MSWWVDQDKPQQLQLLLKISCHVLWRMKSFLFEIVNFKKWQVFFGRCFYNFFCLFQNGTRFNFMVKIDECQITKLHANSNGMKICELNRFWNGLMVELSQCQKYRQTIQLLLIFLRWNHLDLKCVREITMCNVLQRMHCQLINVSIFYWHFAMTFAINKCKSSFRMYSKIVAKLFFQFFFLVLLVFSL